MPCHLCDLYTTLHVAPYCHSLTGLPRVMLLQKTVTLPGFVSEHDAILEDQPLQDYGIVADKNMMPAGVGMPVPS